MDTSSIPLKRCTRCNNEYPATLEYFYSDKRLKSGLFPHCKLCSRERAKAYSRANPDKIKATRRKYNETHAEEIAAYYHLKWVQHPEELRRRVNEWRQSHRQHVNNYNRKKYRLDPRSVLARNQHRARNANAQGSHTATDIDCLYINQRGLCAYCGCKLNGKYHVDHIIPLSRGGSNNADNLVLACAHCNTSKRDKLISEWR